MTVLTMRRGKRTAAGKALAAVLMATTALGAATIVPAPAMAQQTQSYDIPAGPLADVLNQFARQAGIELAYHADLTAGRSSAGLKGSYGPAEGLSHILAGTGITFRQTGPRAFTLEGAPRSADDAIRLGPVRVEGGAASTDAATERAIANSAPNTLRNRSGVARLGTEVQDAPQIVNVVPAEVLREQNVTTLEQALRNVPGITIAIGEANGGANGDRFLIRGFESIGDSYLDGLRDFGVYVHDSFNYEQVQVLKGPSSESFGVGTTGGAINTESKQAQLGTTADANVSAGSGSLVRTTADVNYEFADTVAFRAAGMFNDQNIVDRDGVKSDRWGVAASLGIGLGTDTTWHLNYFHQSNKRTPDYGQPLIARNATDVRYPVATYGVPRSNYYGKETDRDHSDIDMFTSRFSARPATWLTVNNDTRVAIFDRYFSTTTPTCDQACADIYFAGGDPVMGNAGVLPSGGGPTYKQHATSVQNITTAVADFNTGALRHELVFGVDLSHVKDFRQGYSYSVPKNPVPHLLTPDTSANYTVNVNPNNVKRSRQQTYALFASERLWFTNQISILVGGRWDHMDTTYDQVTATARTIREASASYFSPKASAIWEPNDDVTAYFSWSTANNLPYGQNITSDVNPVAAGREDTDPERTNNLELGAKGSILGGRLGLTGALFQVTKNNAFYTDPSGNLVQTGEKQRVRGLELGVTGQFTDAWTLNASYSYMDSEVIKTTNAANLGRPIQGVPKHSGSVWTSYDLTEAVGIGDGKLLIGGGATHKSAMYTRTDGMARVPYNLAFDALISYEVDRYRVAINGYNLANRVNYDAYFPGENLNTARAIPSAGRTIVVTVGAGF